MSISYNICLFIVYVGPTQCQVQDGVTNNCTQECTRDADTGVYNCSCYSDLGYQINPDNDTICIGKLANIQRKFIWTSAILLTVAWTRNPMKFLPQFNSY